jgi:HEAT repeat protein
MGALEPDAIDTLAESLDLADRDLRWAALDLLKKLAGEHRDAVVARAIALGADGSLVQRRMAFYLLRDVAAGEPDARRAAVEALASSDSNLRLAALAALAAAGPHSDEEVSRLVALVGDPDLRVARGAAASLGALRNPPAAVLEALRAARLHADPSLRRAAESSLRKLGAHVGDD